MNTDDFNQNFEPCVIKNLPFHEYLAVDALSNSGIEQFLESPRNYQWSKDNPFEETEETKFGTFVHAVVLEPHLVEREYVRRPPEAVNLAKKPWYDWNQQQKEKGLTVIKFQDWDAAHRIRDELSSLKEDNIDVVYAESEKELSLFWFEEINGTKIKCKSRLDMFLEPVLLDLKTTSRPDDEGFEKESFNRGFHRKMAWYGKGLTFHKMEFKHALIVMIDKSGPKDFKLFRMQNDVVRVGDKQNAKVLKRFEECQRLNQWPGHSKKIVPIGLPTWAINTLPEDELP